jgi:hypothetical protein
MTNILLAGIVILLAYIAALMEASMPQKKEGSWHTVVFVIFLLVAVLFGALLVHLIEMSPLRLA